jgi:hypothetical protein
MFISDTRRRLDLALCFRSFCYTVIYKYFGYADHFRQRGQHMMAWFTTGWGII